MTPKGTNFMLRVVALRASGKQSPRTFREICHLKYLNLFIYFMWIICLVSLIFNITQRGDLNKYLEDMRGWMHGKPGG